MNESELRSGKSAEFVFVLSLMTLIMTMTVKQT